MTLHSGKSASIVIIGGGAAGLTTAGALKHLGIESTILDRDAKVGDVWAHRYDRLQLHTVRQFSGLAHLPIPRHYPRYVTRDQFVQYLQWYAESFAFNIEHNCAVQKITGAANKWTVHTSQGPRQASVVIVATGQYGQPTIPQWTGATEFQGRLIHSIEYKSGRDFSGQRVLVIGSGNSGSEIAIDLVEQGAAFVAHSIRTPSPVVPRDVLGTPVQVFGILMSALPQRFADSLGTAIARVATGDLRSYGVRPPAWHPFTARKSPIIDVGWLSGVKARTIHLRGDVVRFAPSGVVFDNGMPEDFDAVIAATGFTSGLQNLIDADGLVNERGNPAFRSGQPTNHAGFYFMGYTESVRGHLFEANRDSRRLAIMVKRAASISALR